MEQKINVWGFHHKVGKNQKESLENEEKIYNQKIIAIGWKELGDLRKIKPETREEFYNRYKNLHPSDKKKSIETAIGQPYRLLHKMNIGDYIVFRTNYNDVINIGKIDGNYDYDEKEENFANKRSVKWLKSIPSNKFSQDFLNGLNCRNYNIYA